MGRLPEINGVLSLEADRFSAPLGFVSHKKARIDLSAVTFKQIGEGAPALVEWLCRQGCTDLKYDFVPNGVYEGLSDL